MWHSIGYEDPGPMWLCNVALISNVLEGHAACYLKMEATGYSETLVITYNTKLCHIPEDHNLKFQNC
jgi:hypothetical protein